MPQLPSDKVLVDEDYDEEADSDFAPDQAGDDVTSENTSEDEGEVSGSDVPQVSPKWKATSQGDFIDEGFENSGDEAIIQKGAKKRKKKEIVDEKGGEGGLIKTRAQRAVEKEERRVNKPSGPVTIDVDAIFNNMMAGNFDTTTTTTSADPTGSSNTNKEPQASTTATPAPTTSDAKFTHPETILIKRKYNFAGKIHTEEKRVPRFSAEAQLYLSSFTPEEINAVLAESGIDTSDKTSDAPERIPRKAFRSRFEPPIESVTRRSDLQLGIALRMQAREDAKAQAKAKKLNTVEKSRMDWAGFVDKEGLKDELELAGKSKGSFADRHDFLARTEAKREEDVRKARMTARAQEQRV